MENKTQNVTYNMYSIDEWNTQLAELLIPTDVILGLYILAGICGNGLVIFIYGFRLKGKKDDRYFIPYLAVVDLFAALICASSGLAENMMPAKYSNTALCKSWWYFSTLTTVMSTQVLMIIAVHRYRKICKPLAPQMTLKWRQFAMVAALVFSVSLAAPAPYFYGSVTFPNEDGTIIGHRCSKIKEISKIASTIYGGIFGIIAITMIISFIVIYSKVGIQVYIHFQNLKSMKSKAITKTTTKNKPENISYSNNDSTLTNTASTILENESSEDIPPNLKVKNVNTTDNTKEKISESGTPNLDKTNKRVMYRFTLMFMLVTFVFLICFFPKVILMLLEGRDPNFWERFNDSERVWVLWVYDMYIINNVANPIIYGFMDIKFREELRKLCLCRKK